MQNTDNTIFVGTKISEKLRDQLDSSNASVRQFFEDNNPEYLQTMRIDYDEYIGKVTQNGASLEHLSNMVMNVKTMLRMICPDFSFPDDAIKIFAVAPAPARTYL